MFFKGFADKNILTSVTVLKKNFKTTAKEEHRFDYQSVKQCSLDFVTFVSILKYVTIKSSITSKNEESLHFI
jgi:hypothetical protein